MSNMGEIIRAARVKKKLTQERLAHMVGVSKNSVVSWEKGHYSPTGEMLVQLASILDIVEQLFPGYVRANVPPVAVKDDREDVLRRLADLERTIAELQKK